MGVKRLLQSAEMNEMVMRSIVVAFQHHRRMDLEGYPETDSGRELNFFSKIVAIADCYDALTTPRIYRSRSYSAAEAFGIMLDDIGTVFDPVPPEFVCAVPLPLPRGHHAETGIGESALVFRVNHDVELLDRPMIKIVTDTEGKANRPILASAAEKDTDGNYKRNVTAMTPRASSSRTSTKYFSCSETPRCGRPSRFTCNSTLSDV